jgi:hypothetical protein
MLRSRTVTLNPADVANAQLGIDLPVAYGYVRAQGNEILNHALSNKNRIVTRILAEGEWDGIERLFINSKKADESDVTLVHFHPGIDGTLGAGLSPVSNGRLPGSIAPSNLIVNGGGETGTLGAQATGWTLGGGNNLVIANDQQHAGSNSLKISNGTAANSFSSQDFAVVGGLAYTLQGWIMTSGVPSATGDGALLNIDTVSGVTSFSILGKSGFDFLSTQPDVGVAADGAAHAWTFVSCVFIPNASGTIRLYCQLGYGGAVAGTAWFDEVSVAPVNQDQGVDNFWSQLPANFQPTTYSRKAYAMFNVPPDPAAPSATLTIVGDYRTMVVRQFDGSGNQTGYAFSTNGAEQCLDAIARTMLKPEWNPSAARAAGGDFVAAEKARINWSSFADSVSWCNTVLANGQKRFESSIAFPQRTALMDALKQLCLMSQLYITEANGQIYICPDKPRTSTFLLKSDHVVPGTAEFDKINLHGAQNRLVATFNDLNAQGIADIDTIANSGLSRNGQSMVTVQTKTNHPFTVGQSIQIVPPQDGTTHEAAFDGVFNITSIPAANKFTYAQGGNANWALWSEDFTNAVYLYTNATVVGNNQVDPLGGNTADTITSAATGTNWGWGQVLGFNSLNGVPVTAGIWLKAASNISIVIQLSRGAFDTQNVPVTVTNAWQFFSFTHSAVWTGSGAVRVDFGFSAINTSVFAWGLQVADGAGSAYRQTTSAAAGVISGNGTVGTPESRFAVRAPVADHQQHQNAIGQRGLSLTPIFRVVPLSINLGNNTAERAQRIMNFQLNRNLGINTVPYSAPWAGTIKCLMDAVDLSIPGTPRALISQLCGDIITLDATISEEYQGDYEIMKADFTIPAADGSGNSGSGQTNQPTIDLTLLQYLPTAFSDTSNTALSLRAVIPSGLAPLAQVDSNGNQRLRGTFGNNPVNANGILTGSNPLTQSGGTSTILVAACVIQFGDGQVSYNSGSVTPSGLGTWLVYCIDPAFTGGSVVFLATQSEHIKTSNNGIVTFGTITTVSGGGGTGTGGGSGAGNGFGGGNRLPNP